MAQYIQKDILVAEIEKRRDAALTRQHNLKAIGEETILNEMIAFELNRIISFLDTLEVKEVDLEKEIDKWWWGRTWQTYGMMLNSYNIRDFAKHFFELGLKAQKGEII